MFRNFFKNKRVFITGHTGFKGSWLLLWLDYLGAKIKGYALAPYTQNDHFVAACLEKKIISVIADIRDNSKLKKEILEFEPEVIFHLAAQPLVRLSYLNPRDTYEINVMGTVNILDSIRECKSVISFINVTTDKCYENIEKEEGYKEDEPLGGYDPYSSSKGCSELVTSAYRRSFFNSSSWKGHNILIASARAGNVIGGGDWRNDRLMSDSIGALMKNKRINIRNPQAVRPWQYVLEPLSGYLWLAAQASEENYADFAGAWNFGPDLTSLVKVKDVVEFAIKYWGSGSWQEVSNREAFHEASLLHLDCTKAANKLKWKPVLDVPESIEMTVDWYKYFFKKSGNIYDFSLNQLKNYIRRAEEKKNEWAIN